MASRAREEPLLVVGSGRCGSTLISNLLSDAPEILSLSEFFFSLQPNGFSTEPVDGAEFWRWMSVPHLETRIMGEFGVLPKEFLYDLHGGHRFDVETGIPPILLTALPALTPDFMALYDELEAWVPRQPQADVSTHYRTLFGWLADRLGKARWSERSGGSSAYLAELIATFPDARFVHVYRDGVPAALSMNRHLNFRMEQIRGQFRRDTGFDPWTGDEPPPGWEPTPDLVRFMPDDFDVDAFVSLYLPRRKLGGYWSRMIRLGIRNLRTFDQDRVHHLCYETLLEDPYGELTRLAKFVDVDEPEAWVERSAPKVGRQETAVEESAEELAELEKACRPGRLELKKAGLRTVDPGPSVRESAAGDDED